MNQILALILVFVLIELNSGSDRWPNHDISTLKLLQLVHRHGERAPAKFAPKDPFKHKKYWPEGFGGLTLKGKYRLYKLGEFIRNEYKNYLGDKYSPREVYARSSVAHRCIESVSSLLAGAYPPRKDNWQWNNGSDANLGQVWQPIPIETYMPHMNDTVCNQGRACPIMDEERAKLFETPEMKNALKKFDKLNTYLARITGMKMNFLNAYYLPDSLTLELDRNYIWNNTWTREEQQSIVDQLNAENQVTFPNLWRTPITKRFSAGGLVRELTNNMHKVVNQTNDKKLVVYSSHDIQVAALMSALDVYDNLMPPFGATLLLELHKKTNNTYLKSDYFVRLFYQNETIVNTGIPHPIQLTNCRKQYDCPLHEFLRSTKPLLYNDFDRECKARNHYKGLFGTRLLDFSKLFQVWY